MYTVEHSCQLVIKNIANSDKESPVLLFNSEKNWQLVYITHSHTPLKSQFKWQVIKRDEHPHCHKTTVSVVKWH